MSSATKTPVRKLDVGASDRPDRSNRSRPSWYTFAVAGLVLFSLCRGVMWTVLSPPWEAPDEPAHAAYAEHLRVTHNPFVRLAYGNAALVESVSDAQLGEISHHTDNPGALGSQELADRRARTEATTDAEISTVAEFPSSASGSPPLYYALGALVMGSVHRGGGTYLAQIEALRLLSVVIAALALYFQIRVMEELFGRDIRTTAGGALIALMPMYSFLSAAFNPDALMALTMSGALFTGLRLISRPASWKGGLAFAAFVATALLTKQSGMALIPLVFLVCVVGWRGNTHSRRAKIAWTATIGGIALLPYGLYSHLAARGSSVSSFAASDGARSVHRGFLEYLSLVQSNLTGFYFSGFWGNYGWLDTSFGARGYQWVLVLGALALFGAGGVVLNSRRIDLRWFAVILTLASLAVILFGIEYLLFTSGQGGFLQGRYFFPLVVAITAIYVAGITAPFRRTWVGNALLAGSVAGLLAYHIITVVFLVMPRYTL